MITLCNIVRLIMQRIIIEKVNKSRVPNNFSLYKIGQQISGKQWYLKNRIINKGGGVLSILPISIFDGLL